MSYRIILDNRVKRDYANFSDETVKRIDRKLIELAENPRPRGALKLKNRKGNGYRIRIGDLRLLYTVDDIDRFVKVYSIGNRKEVYRKR